MRRERREERSGKEREGRREREECEGNREGWKRGIWLCVYLSNTICTFLSAVLKISSQNPELEEGTELEVKHVRK